MPTIQLYSSPANPNAWHRVRAPGGYEWWRFDAYDAQHDRHLAIIFYEGFVFDPVFQQRYAQYCRHPTRYPPPLPSEFPCVHFAMHERGELRAQFTTPRIANQFHESNESTAITIGDNRVETADDGSHIALRGPSLAAKLIFRPLFQHPPLLRAIHAEHYWIIADPLCEVAGTIEFAGETIEFRGRGFRDHQFGLSPPVSRSVHGYVLLEDSACAFHIAPSLIFVEADAAGLRETRIACMEFDWQSALPRIIDFDGVLSISNPRLLEIAPARARYDAVWRGRSGEAICGIGSHDSGR
ncbi:MAG TPA: hypothetical protein VKK61_06565 [Tepidisphaeraceae bacterium]|nr:hypothetical protein [Tepidisphaeraceae bacterium]